MFKYLLIIMFLFFSFVSCNNPIIEDIFNNDSTEYDLVGSWFADNGDSFIFDSVKVDIYFRSSDLLYNGGYSYDNINKFLSIALTNGNLYERYIEIFNGDLLYIENNYYKKF